MQDRIIGITPAVILINPKFPHNVGAALRACSCFGVRQLWWTGIRVTVDQEKGEGLPREERMKGYRSVEFRRHERPLDFFGKDATPVAVEVREHSESLVQFEHPANAVYLFGPEDGSIPKPWLTLCHRFVFIPSHHCLNLAAAVNVILYDRRQKMQMSGREKLFRLDEILFEHRGTSPVMDSMGWDGK